MLVLPSTRIYTAANIAATQYTVAQVQAAFKGLGMAVPTDVVYGDPISDPTLAASAAKVTAGGVNGIVMLPVDPALMVKALQGAGYQGHLGTISTDIEAALPTMGTLADGILISSQTAFPSETSNAAVKTFLSDMKRYQPGGTVNGNSLGAYAAVELFKTVATTSTAKTLDAATFKAAANKFAPPVSLGLIGPWAIKGRTPQLSAYPGFSTRISLSELSRMVWWFRSAADLSTPLRRRRRSAKGLGSLGVIRREGRSVGGDRAPPPALQRLIHPDR